MIIFVQYTKVVQHVVRLPDWITVTAGVKNVMLLRLQPHFSVIAVPNQELLRALWPGNVKIMTFVKEKLSEHLFLAKVSVLAYLRSSISAMNRVSEVNKLVFSTVRAFLLPIPWRRIYNVRDGEYKGVEQGSVEVSSSKTYNVRGDKFTGVEQGNTELSSNKTYNVRDDISAEVQQCHAEDSLSDFYNVRESKSTKV